MSVRQIKIEFGNIGFSRSSPILGLGLSVVAEYVTEKSLRYFDRPEFETPTSRKIRTFTTTLLRIQRNI